MINYETYCKIRDHRERQGLTITQTARAFGSTHRDGLEVVARRTLSSNRVSSVAAGSISTRH